MKLPSHSGAHTPAALSRSRIPARIALHLTFLLAAGVAACSTAQPASRTPAERRDSLVWERDFTISLRQKSTAHIRRLDSTYALIDRRRVEKLASLDSLLARPE